VLLLEELEPLLQGLLELLHAAALEQHVPVRALMLLVGVFRLLAVDQDGLLAGLGGPHRGDLRLGGEHHRHGLAVRGAVLHALARGRFHTRFGLHGLGTQAHAP